jgi:Polyketide cyclase / dehydrase and lipid transport
MQFDSSIQIDAPANAIFNVYSRVSDWPSWDLDLKAAKLEGAFVSGTQGVIEPKGGPKSKILLSNVVKNQQFDVTCKLPLCTMRFEHLLKPQEGKTLVTHRVVFEGLLAPVFGRLIGSGMRKTLPNVMQSLKAAVEQKQ